MMRAPLFEPGIMSGGAEFWAGRTSSLELGIMVGFACFCVNHTQLKSKPSDEQMATARRSNLMRWMITGRLS
jgi:hypothetical protein